MHKNSLAPKVSVGLPVYNGERYVAEAIESILAQTYENFELIISDNASIDRTEEICRAYATIDARIKYHRADRNLGAAANFNRVFQLASGEYFKWAAHDDMIEPQYLEKCVAALDADPDAVLCYPLTKEIDESGNELSVAQSRLVGADSDSVSARFAVLVSYVRECTEIFGMMRTAALRRTRLHQSYEGEDKALLAELALLGWFIELPEPLFLHREHPDRFARAARVVGRWGVDAEKCLTWYDPDRAGRRMLYRWRLSFDYFRMVLRHVSQPWECLRSYAHLASWMRVRRGALAIEVFMVVDPKVRLYDLLQAVRRRLRTRATSAVER